LCAPAEKAILSLAHAPEFIGVIPGLKCFMMLMASLNRVVRVHTRLLTSQHSVLSVISPRPRSHLQLGQTNLISTTLKLAYSDTMIQMPTWKTGCMLPMHRYRTSGNQPQHPTYCPLRVPRHRALRHQTVLQRPTRDLQGRVGPKCPSLDSTWWARAHKILEPGPCRRLGLGSGFRVRIDETCDRTTTR